MTRRYDFMIDGHRYSFGALNEMQLSNLVWMLQAISFGADVQILPTGSGTPSYHFPEVPDRRPRHGLTNPHIITVEARS